MNRVIKRGRTTYSKLAILALEFLSGRVNMILLDFKGLQYIKSCDLTYKRNTLKNEKIWPFGYCSGRSGAFKWSLGCLRLLWRADP